MCIDGVLAATSGLCQKLCFALYAWFHWRRFLLEEGDGGEIETPKASRGKGMGRCPLPSRLGGLGSVVSSPCRKRVLEHFELERTHVVTIINLGFLAGGRPT